MFQDCWHAPRFQISKKNNRNHIITPEITPEIAIPGLEGKETKRKEKKRKEKKSIAFWSRRDVLS